MYFWRAGRAVSAVRCRIDGTWSGLAWTGSRGNRWDVSTTGSEIEEEMGAGYFLPTTVTASANKKGGAIKFL
jgi:hypothetical protein